MKKKLNDLIEVLPQIVVLGCLMVVAATCLILPAVAGVVKFLAYWRIAFGH